MNRSSINRNRSRKTISRQRAASGRRSLARVEVLEQRLALSAAAGTIDTGIDELLVEYLPQADVQVRAANRDNGQFGLVRELDNPVRRAMGFGIMEVVRIAPGGDIQAAARWFGTQPGVKFAEPNQRVAPAAVSNDPEYLAGGLWGAYGPDSPAPVGPGGTTNAFGTDAESVWNDGNTGSSSVFVGIVDQGVDIYHPDLAGNIWVNPYDAVDGVDNDGNGFVDDTNGWDFAANDRTVYDGPSDSHGTHVAGTIAAVGGNGIGVAGMNWDATMIVTKFMSESGGTLDNAIRAVDYLTDLKIRHGIDIVASNNSWIGGGYMQAMHEAILRAAAADILFVAAAGNYGVNNDSYLAHPSSYTSLTGSSTMPAALYESVIAVAAIDASGALPSYSSYGTTTVDIAAPGSAIRSTLPGGTYGEMTGTSMATAQVSGAIALLKASHPNQPAWKLAAAILDTATPTASMAGRISTGGRLNVHDASAAAVWATPANLPTAVIDDVATIEGHSGSIVKQFTVRLSNAYDQAVSASWSTRDVTANAGSDYTAASGTLVIPAGSTMGTIQVVVAGDRLIEGDETFAVDLTAANNARVTKGTGVVRIVNDDYAPPVVTVMNVSSNEGNNNKNSLIFQVVLDAPAREDLLIDYATADGSATAGIDYAATSGQLGIPVGAISASIRVPILGDRVVEPDETVLLNLSMPDPWFTLNPNQALGTILDDDTKGGRGGGRNSSASFSEDAPVHLIAAPAAAEIPATFMTVDSQAFRNLKRFRGFGWSSNGSAGRI